MIFLGIWDKMILGGIIVFDDFGFRECEGVTKYVEEQMMIRDRLVIHNLNGHAIILKL
jgi:O-methyltransferase